VRKSPAVLHAHGFSRVDTDQIRALLEWHKEAFITLHVASAEYLRREASRMDDLGKLIFETEARHWARDE